MDNQELVDSLTKGLAVMTYGLKEVRNGKDIITELLLMRDYYNSYGILSQFTSQEILIRIDNCKGMQSFLLDTLVQLRMMIGVDTYETSLKRVVAVLDSIVIPMEEGDDIDIDNLTIMKKPLTFLANHNAYQIVLMISVLKPHISEIPK